MTIKYFQRQTGRRRLTRLEEEWCDRALRLLTLAGLVRDVNPNRGETSTIGLEPGQSPDKETP